MLTPEPEQTDLEQSILAILRQMPLTIQQSKLTQAEIDLDQAINYVLEKNSELLDRLA